jgi:uncharacterized phage protein (TIGR01671 family)
MRQIKFRAWDKRKKVMSATFSIFDIFTTQTIKDSCVSTVTHFPYGIEAKKNDDIVLMQYTGLKDKNGKEIYEGDIVSLNGVIGYGQPIKENHAVICDNGSPKINNGYEYVFLEEFVFVGNSKHEEFHNDTEIIGNVWENPELIEKP